MSINAISLLPMRESDYPGWLKKMGTLLHKIDSFSGPRLLQQIMHTIFVRSPSVPQHVKQIQDHNLNSTTDSRPFFHAEIASYYVDEMLASFTDLFPGSRRFKWTAEDYMQIAEFEDRSDDDIVAAISHPAKNMSRKHLNVLLRMAVFRGVGNSTVLEMLRANRAKIRE